MDANLNLPQDRDSLEALLRQLMVERDQQQQRADEQNKRAQDLHVEILRQAKRADELYLQNLRLQQKLERYEKWYYGPRGDRLQSSADVAQALLEFAQQLESKPVHSEDVPADTPEYEVRRVKRRKDGAISPTSKIFPSPPTSTNSMAKSDYVHAAESSGKR